MLFKEITLKEKKKKSISQFLMMNCYMILTYVNKEIKIMYYIE